MHRAPDCAHTRRSVRHGELGEDDLAGDHYAVAHDTFSGIFPYTPCERGLFHRAVHENAQQSSSCAGTLPRPSFVPIIGVLLGSGKRWDLCTPDAWRDFKDIMSWSRRCQAEGSGGALKRATRRLAILALLTASLLTGCRVMGLFHREVSHPPAPSALPLPAIPPDTSATPQAPPEDDEASGLLATRVIPPEDEIRLPPGFGISVFADGLRGPRMMSLGPDGHIYVAERGAGRIVRLPDRDGDGVADAVEVAAEGLNGPSSIDFYQDGSLYVGETQRILRLRDRDRDGQFEERDVVIGGLPSGGHNTRTVLFSPDWRFLYVSVGSSCNVCVEEDERRATVMRYRPDGTEAVVFAEGLRNAVGITFRPGTSQLWASNNGRDWMGDNQPPETIYLVEEGDDAGWPRCHAGRIVDPDYGNQGACEGVTDPAVEMQAHSAPLGLTFYAGKQFPPDYQGDLFVAFHGSWNRTTPTGYKVVRVPVQGTETGTVVDFAVGWLRQNGSSWGRPVDVMTAPDGSLLISDDAQGFIYRVFYHGT